MLLTPALDNLKGNQRPLMFHQKAWAEVSEDIDLKDWVIKNI